MQAVSVGRAALSNAGSIMVGNNVSGLSVAQQAGAMLQTNTPVTATGNSSSPTSGSTGSATSTTLPQMLFLNQVTLNGQTSFVLVDANNKPVQLPQGIQVINLPTQNSGSQQTAVSHIIFMHRSYKISNI